MKGKKKKTSKAFDVLQRIGKSFMIPIAVLPIAGILLGIGSAFTNPTTIATYNLEWLIHEGSFLYGVFDIMAKTGSAIFNNLAVIFAISLAFGMAKQEKGVAALSGALAFLVLNAVIAAFINMAGGTSAFPDGFCGEILGITTLQTGVFSGIITGLIVAWLHNRFYNIRLPMVFSFFEGVRFVPIICCVVFIFVGALTFLVWPFFQYGIMHLGTLVTDTGYAGTWIYGTIKRALIPFGLHHVFYLPFWQTALGGSMVIDGQLVEGAQNIFFAQLASPNTTSFSVDATRFFTGEFVFMIFGLPAAALAIFLAAVPAKRKIVGGLLLAAAVTSILTGITEPIEFTFLFVAPILYAVHCVLAGLAYMIMHMLNVTIGLTFSGGLIDFVLFGVLPGNDMTNWVMVIVVGIIYAFVYFFLFYFAITRFNLKTPGREDDDKEVKLYTKQDCIDKANNNNQCKVIVEGLGGVENISEIDACATRLRITVNNGDKVNIDHLKTTAALAVLSKGTGVQMVYGPQVNRIKRALIDYVNGVPSQDEQNSAAQENKPAEDVIKSDSASGEEEIYSFTEGKLLAITEVEDETFASKVLGDGVAIEPTGNKLYAPCNATVDSVLEQKHAVTLVSSNGINLLLHVGIDTVNLKGKYFISHVSAGQEVKKGDLLLTFDREAIIREGYKVTTSLIVCDDDAVIETVNSSGDAEKNVLLLKVHK